MPIKDYYTLLEIAPTASHDEVKRAFRLQIARYHPDKVQHLGKEFQAIAAERAAALTEAYHMLSDRLRRAEYDRARETAMRASGPAAAPQLSEMPQHEHGASRGAPSTAEPEEEPARRTPRSQFIHERVRRDEFVRKAAIGRFRQAMAAVSDAYDEAVVRGFDVACVPKAKLFGRGKGPRLLGRFVPCVDGEAVADAWTQAGRWCGPSNEDVCVFLIGSAVAPPRELADAIAKQRRKPAAGRVTLIPLDARDWRAHLPTDAPELAKNLVARLRDGA